MTPQPFSLGRTAGQRLGLREHDSRAVMSAAKRELREHLPIAGAPRQ